MEIQSPGQSDKAVLGEGYNTKNEDFVGECVTGTVEFVGIPEATLNYSKVLESKQLSDELGFSVGGKARYGVVEGSMSAKFASEASSNNYSEVTIFSAKYHFKNKKLKYEGLTNVGKQAKGFGDNNNFVGENWVTTCGHEYVEQIKLGAAIYVSAKIEFSNKAAKESFKAKFEVKGPVFEASGDFTKEAKSFGSSASISIQAYQLGGDVSRLGDIFGGNENLIDSSGKKIHALLVCSMANPEPCLQILSSAIEYATNTDDPNSFPNQIKNIDLNSPIGPAELAYLTSPYADLSLIPPPAIISEGIKVARDELSFEFEKNFTYRNRVRALKTGPMRLSKRQQKNIEDIDKDIAINLEIIQETAFICYTDLDNCVEAVSNAKQKLKTINEEDLEIFPETIAQWYDIKDVPETKKSIQHTLNILVEKVKNKVVDFENISDKSATVESLLLEIKDLDLSSISLPEVSIDLGILSLLKNLNFLNLSDNQIVDVAPLSLLTNLNLLDLHKNQIIDVTPLSLLTKLTDININNNQVVDISSLSSLTNLIGISLAGNQIVDISPLASLTKLKGLESLGNQIVDISPLASLTNLSGINISENQIVDISPLSSLTNLTNIRLLKNKIVDVSPLASLTNLVDLYLDENQIVDVSPLASLTNLTRFSLFSNQIVDISPLASLTKLEGLNLANNQIVDVSPLASLVKPLWLYLLNNPISNKTCPVPEPNDKICHFN